MKAIRFKIERYKPGVIDPPQFYSYTLEVLSGMSVLDCLEKIRLTLDDTIVYRHSCHHSACGTCACIINGMERLACITRVDTLPGDTITLEALRGFPRIADLAVDMTGFYRDINSRWHTLKPAESQPQADSGAQKEAVRLEDCIECGACVSSCPAMHRSTGFMGPAALAALNNELKKVPHEKRTALHQTASGPRGERLCERALNCSRVCPTGVYPAKHIVELRKTTGLR